MQFSGMWTSISGEGRSKAMDINVASPGWIESMHSLLFLANSIRPTLSMCIHILPNVDDSDALHFWFSQSCGDAKSTVRTLRFWSLKRCDLVAR